MKKYFFGYLLTSLFNVLSLKLYSNTLSLEQFGEFSYLQSFFIIISTFFSKFISQSVYKFYTGYAADKGRFASFIAVVWQYMIAYVLLIILVQCGVCQYLGYDLLSLKSLAVVCITIFIFLVDIQNAYLQSSDRPSAFIRNEILRCILKLVLPFLFLNYVSNTLVSFLSGFALAHMVTPAIQAFRYFVQKKSSNAMVSTTGEEEKNIRNIMFKYSYAISLWYVMIQFVNYIDRVYLFDKFGAEIIGKYAANFSVFSFASQIIAMPLISALHPKLLKLNTDTEESKTQLQSLLNRYSNDYIKVQFIIIGFLVFWYQEITSILLNKTFILNFWEIFVLVVGYSFWNLGSYGNKIFETSSNTQSMLITLAASIVIYLPLLSILSKSIGPYSIFVAKAVMYFSYPVVQIAYNRISLNRGIRQVKWEPNIIKALLIAFIWFMGFFIYSNLGISDYGNYVIALSQKVVCFLIWLFLILTLLLSKNDLSFVMNLKERANGLFK